MNTRSYSLAALVSLLLFALGFSSCSHQDQDHNGLIDFGDPGSQHAQHVERVWLVSEDGTCEPGWVVR